MLSYKLILFSSQLVIQALLCITRNLYLLDPRGDFCDILLIITITRYFRIIFSNRGILIVMFLHFKHLHSFH